MDKNEFQRIQQEISRELLKDWKPPKVGRQVVYASAEVLPGRILLNNLMNLPDDHPIRRKMEACGITAEQLAKMEEQAADAAMGNGGLGRLAACMLESATNGGLPFTLSTICYNEGLFKQDIRYGRQTEQPDLWLEPDGSHPFEQICRERVQRVYFRHSDNNWVEVEMVPSLFPQVGLNGHVNVVLAWKVGQVRSQRPTDLTRYYNIDKQLYGKDSHDEGKKLRICQFYALSTATVGWMLDHCKANSIPVERIPEQFCLHINDTHCAFMIPELLRRLLDENGLSWKKAEKIVRETFVYTNHTILAEALEKWPVWMIREMMPRISELVWTLSDSAACYYRNRCPGIPETDIDKMRIVRHDQVHMAHMAIVNSYSVNGVARIHTNILCQRELKPFYNQEPRKFHNVTNGVSQRLFLAAANPALAKLIDECIGSAGWRTDMSKISSMKPYISKPEVQKRFLDIRKECKKQLSRYLAEHQGVEIPPHFMFDIQVKRIHLYKRQLMNCLRILDLYFRLKDDPGMELAPVAFIFGGKAAMEYRQAKLVIELIHAIARMVNNDPDVRDKMRVCFVKNYNVSKAMLLFPATDISEQISTASKEASGTGCFKAQMNGSILLGTMDGANVEISEAVGEDAMFVFGMRSGEIMACEKHGGYDPMKLYHAEPRIRRAVNALVDGTLLRDHPPAGEPDRFDELWNALLLGENGNRPDSFFVLGDLMSYIEASDRANTLYRRDPARWAELSLHNIACSGDFSSDRMVTEYAREIWKL